MEGETIVSIRTKRGKTVNIAALLEKSARLYADRPALARGLEVVSTYGEFYRQVAGLATALRMGMGLATGDRVAIVMSNCPEFAIAKWACWHAGLCAVPINAKLHRREFAYILENSGARLCFASPDKAETLAGLEDEVPHLERTILAEGSDWRAMLGSVPLPLADADPTDPAWLFYTSGTTGRPKGAILSHRSLMVATLNYFADVDSVAPSDCIIHCAPMSHGSGCYAPPHVARGAAQVIPESGGFEPAETIELIQHWAGATFFFAPTMVVRLLDHPGVQEADFTNLKTIVYGGGPMYVADLLRGIDVLGQKFVQIYGQGEAPMTITGLSRAQHMDTKHPRYLERLASVGVARTDVEVKIFDEEDNEMAAGEVGEVVVRGDVVMTGYWQNPEATAAAMRSGWLHTGDMGAMDDDGFVTLKDRSKDMIISGGTNIYPREIEEVILTHPGVAEVSIIGKPHPEWGEDVCAYVVRHAGSDVDKASIDRLCLDNIARFKRPKHYRFVDALPKNNYGKVLKTELREWLAAEENATAAS